jgi:hypothetical protein
MDKLPGAGELLRRSWDAFEARWQLYVGIALVPAAIGLVGALAGMAFGMGGEGLVPGAIALPLIALALIFFVAILVLSVWAQVALTYAALTEGPLTVKGAFQGSLEKLRPYIWTALWVGLTTLAGFILLIVPGVIFATWYCLTSFVVVGEGLRSGKAMQQSKHYVSGYTAAVLGRLILFGLMVIAISIAASFALGAFLGEKPASLISNLLSVVIQPVAVLYLSHMYRELKARKEVLPATLAEAPSAA